MICVPIKSDDESILVKQLLQVQKNSFVDVVELWLDELNVIPIKINKIKEKPFIYKSIGNIKKIKIILGKLRIDYIDLDISANSVIRKYIRKHHPKLKIIGSFHDYKKTPDINTLKKIASKIDKSGADIIKISTHANHLTDSMRML
ncbi:MAG: type I 3-dehydroquinate dehydratase, partial [Candidatus Gracilibacteria bacterium]